MIVGEVVKTTLSNREKRGYFYKAGAVDRITQEIVRRTSTWFRNENDRERFIDVVEECIMAEELHPKSIRAQRFFASICVSGWNDWANNASEMI